MKLKKKILILKNFLKPLLLKLKAHKETYNDKTNIKLNLIGDNFYNKKNPFFDIIIKIFFHNF